MNWFEWFIFTTKYNRHHGKTDSQWMVRIKISPLKSKNMKNGENMKCLEYICDDKWMNQTALSLVSFIYDINGAAHINKMHWILWKIIMKMFTSVVCQHKQFFLYFFWWRIAHFVSITQFSHGTFWGSPKNVYSIEEILWRDPKC